MKENNITSNKKEKLSLKEKITVVVSMVVVAGMMITSSAYASMSLDDLGDAGGTLKKIIQLIFLLSKVGGFVLALFGLVKLIKYIQDHETAAPDALPKALGMLIGGIALFFVEALLAAIGLKF